MSKRNALASKQLALALNFEYVGSPKHNVDEYRLKATGKESMIIEYNEPMKEDRMLFLKGRMMNLSQELKIINTELKQSVELSDCSKLIDAIINDITSASNNLHIAYYDAQQMTSSK